MGYREWNMQRTFFENLLNSKLDGSKTMAPPKPLRKWTFDEVLSEGELASELNEGDEGYADKEQGILALMAEYCILPSFRTQAAGCSEREFYKLFITTVQEDETEKAKKRYWMLFDWVVNGFLMELNREQFEEMSEVIRGKT